MGSNPTIRCLSAALLTLLWLAAPLGAGNVKTDGQFISTEPTAPPLAVSSSTKVDNLDADLLDGMSAADFFTQDQSMVRRLVFPNAVNTIFVVPNGVTSLQVTVIGAGGGGGGADDFAGGGGGGSGTVINTTVLVSGGDNLTVEVGAGGAGGTAFMTDPGDPGAASILSGTGWRVEADGGEGGEGSGLQDGGDGGSGLFGGGGGGGQISSGLGGNGIFANGEDAAGVGGDGASGGSGGGGLRGGGGGGPGGGDAGSPGTQPGAGGGGGNTFGGGGDGASGAIVIEWFGPPLPN